MSDDLIEAISRLTCMIEEKFDITHYPLVEDSPMLVLKKQLDHLNKNLVEIVALLEEL